MRSEFRHPASVGETGELNRLIQFRRKGNGFEPLASPFQSTDRVAGFRVYRAARCSIPGESTNGLL